MTRSAPPEQIEFTAAEPGAVVAAVGELLAAGQGWINLDPEVERDVAEAVRPSVVTSLFRAAGPPIPSITVVAPGTGRRARAPQLGISHGVGTGVMRRLAAEGQTRPEGWQVVQDHARRGLVIDLPREVAPAALVEWALNAATLLCPVETTGAWLAEVHRG